MKRSFKRVKRVSRKKSKKGKNLFGKTPNCDVKGCKNPVCQIAQLQGTTSYIKSCKKHSLELAPDLFDIIQNSCFVQNINV